MPVSLGLQAFRPASWLVTADNDAARNPARFIVCREAEHRQNKVLHAVIKMKEPTLRRYFTGRSVKPLNGAEVKSFGTERLRKDNPRGCQARI